MQKRMAEAEAAGMEAKALLARAQADRADAGAQLDRLRQIMEAVQAAGAVVQAPGIAAAADTFLRAAQAADSAEAVPSIDAAAVPVPAVPERTMPAQPDAQPF